MRSLFFLVARPTNALLFGVCFLFSLQSSTEASANCGPKFSITKSAASRKSVGLAKRYARKKVRATAIKRCARIKAKAYKVFLRWKYKGCHKKNGLIYCRAGNAFRCCTKAGSSKRHARRSRKHKRKTRKRMLRLKKKSHVVRLKDPADTKTVRVRKRRARKKVRRRVRRKVRRKRARIARKNRNARRGNGACRAKFRVVGQGSKARTRNKSRKTARDRVYRKAKAKCSGRRVVYVSRWEYRCPKVKKGLYYHCKARNFVRCCRSSKVKRRYTKRKRTKRTPKRQTN